jgi:hypothetical protein
VLRNPTRLNWRTVLTVFVLCSTLAGLATGALLAALGDLLTPEARLGLATLLALVFLAIGGGELAGRIKPLQCDRETPRHWVDRGPVAWAVRNGLALGCGATSRLGFALWYLVPATAFLSGSPLLGALLYGSYGAVRGLSAWAIILATRRRPFETISEWLLSRTAAAGAVTAARLVATGTAVVVAVGL